MCNTIPGWIFGSFQHSRPASLRHTEHGQTQPRSCLHHRRKLTWMDHAKGCTSSGEKFLLREDTDTQRHKSLVFSTDWNIQHLCAKKTDFSHPILYSCITFFTHRHVCSLHAIVNGNMFPSTLDFYPTYTLYLYMEYNKNGQ